TTFCLGLREKYWKEHVRDMLAGIDGNSAPCLLLDPLTAQQFIDRGGFTKKADLIRFIHETAEMPAGRYWDLQLVQNYVYPRATFGEEPMATWLKANEDELIRIFPEKDINVVVVGGEANGYWRIMGAKYRKTISVDAWRGAGSHRDPIRPPFCTRNFCLGFVWQCRLRIPGPPDQACGAVSGWWCHRHCRTAGCSWHVHGSRPANSNRKPGWRRRRARNQASDRSPCRWLHAHVGRRIEHICDADDSIQSRFR